MIASTIGSSVRLLFTSGVTIADGLIRYFTASPASHVAIAIGEGGQTLVHAVPQGVIIQSRESWLKNNKNWVVAEYEIVPDVSVGLQDVLGYVGEHYDFLFPANYILVYFYRRIVAGPLRLFYREFRSTQTCAQLVLLLDRSCRKIPEWCGVDFAGVLPADLLDHAVGPSFKKIQ